MPNPQGNDGGEPAAGLQVACANCGVDITELCSLLMLRPVTAKVRLGLETMEIVVDMGPTPLYPMACPACGASKFQTFGPPPRPRIEKATSEETTIIKATR